MDLPTFVGALYHALVGLLVAAPALVATALWRQRRGVRLADAVAVGVVFALALALRLDLPAALHDVRPRVTDAVLGLTPVRFDHGLGPPALVRALHVLIPVPRDELVHLHATAVLSALVPPVLVVFLRLTGSGTATAALAGLVLASWGVDVRFAHTDAPQPVENLLGLLGLTLAGAHLRRPDGPTALAAGLLLGLATTMRPEALLLPIVHTVVLAGSFADAPGRHHPATRVGLLAWGAVTLPHAVGLLVDTWEHIGSSIGTEGRVEHGLLTYGPAHLLSASRAHGHLVLALAALAGLVAGAGPARRRLALGAAVVLTSAFVPAVVWSPGHEASIGLARHQLRTLPWSAALAALGAEAAALRIGGTLGPAAAGLVVLAAFETLPGGAAPSTLSDEYRFVRTHLPQVPEPCTIVSPAPYGDMALSPPSWLSRQWGLQHRWVGWNEPLPVSGCVVWWRSSACEVLPDHLRAQAHADTRQPFDRCAPWEAARVLSPIAEAELPARGWLVERYARDQVRVGFYRVDGLAGP